MDQYRIDSHKLMYHVPRVNAWILKALSTDKRQRSADAPSMRAELAAVSTDKENAA